MIPEIFRLGPIPLHSFGLMMMLGFVAAWRRLELSLESGGQPIERAQDMVFWAGIGGLIGAKLFFFASFPEVFAREGFAGGIISSGFIFYGGLIGGALAVWLYLRARHVYFLHYCDMAAPALALGYAIGRIGCHLAGDGCYGVATALPWGFSYAAGVVETAPGAHVHPTPVYETLVGLVLTMLLVWRERRGGIAVGRQFGVYLLVSAAARFLVEMIRVEPVVAGGLTQAQYISILLAIPAVWLLVRPSRPVVVQANADEGG